MTSMQIEVVDIEIRSDMQLIHPFSLTQLLYFPYTRASISFPNRRSFWFIDLTRFQKPLHPKKKKKNIDNSANIILATSLLI